MATPAASAWHRRRNVLFTPASTVTSVRHSSSLRSSAKSRSDSPHSAAPELRPETAASSSWSPKETLIRSQYYQLPPLQFDFLQHLTAIFRSGTQDGIVKSAVVTLFLSLLASILISLSNNLTALFIPRQKLTFPITLHRFPYILTVFRLIAAFLYSLTLFSIQFLFSSVIRGEMRSWRRNAQVGISADRGRSRLRMLHAIGSMSACVLQTIFLAYIICGPSLVPTVDTGLLNSSFFPSWSSLSLHTITALFSGFFFSMLWMWVEAHSLHHNPLCLSALRRVIINGPRILLLSSVPVLCAVLPSWLIHLILTDSVGSESSDLGIWVSIVSGLGRRFSILLCVMTSLLSWNITSVLEHHVFAPSNISYPGAGPLGISSLTAEEIAWYRDRIMVIVQRFDSLKMPDDQPEKSTTELLDALRALAQTAEGLVEFPGFLDASGEVWRSTLRVCLSPIELFTMSLLEHNSTQHVSLSNSARTNRSLFVGPSRTGLHSLWLFLHGGKKWFSFPASDVCITACEVLAKVAISSYDMDQFGVVHRTLPQLMRTLLACKEQTVVFINSRESCTANEPSPGFSLEETRAMRWCQKALRLPSDFDMVVAVDDTLTLVIHRIVGMFRSHMQSFVDGFEVSWDRSQDRLLQQFLDHNM